MWWLSSTVVSYGNKKSDQQVQVRFLNLMSHGRELTVMKTHYLLPFSEYTFSHPRPGCEVHLKCRIIISTYSHIKP